MTKKKKASSRPAKPKYPNVFEMVKSRMIREGRYEEMLSRYQFHRDFGMAHNAAMWEAIRDMGYESPAKERAAYDAHNKAVLVQRESERVQAMNEEQRLEEQAKVRLDELARRSKDQKFDAVAGIEWVASVFHNKDISPADCPHIIAWNVLQTSKKYEVAFFKDFLMKALQKGVTIESSEEFAEDESQLDDLRRAVQEAINA